MNWIRDFVVCCENFFVGVNPPADAVDFGTSGLVFVDGLRITMCCGEDYVAALSLNGFLLYLKKIVILTLKYGMNS